MRSGPSDVTSAGSSAERVGLSGNDYTHPEAFTAWFRGDIVVCSVLFAVGGAVSWRTIRSDVLAPAWTFPVVRRMPEVRRAIASPFEHGEFQFGERRDLGRELRSEAYDQAIRERYRFYSYGDAMVIL